MISSSSRSKNGVRFMLPLLYRAAYGPSARIDGVEKECAALSSCRYEIDVTVHVYLIDALAGIPSLIVVVSDFDDVAILYTRDDLLKANDPLPDESGVLLRVEGLRPAVHGWNDRTMCAERQRTQIAHASAARAILAQDRQPGCPRSVLRCDHQVLYGFRNLRLGSMD